LYQGATAGKTIAWALARIRPKVAQYGKKLNSSETGNEGDIYVFRVEVQLFGGRDIVGVCSYGRNPS